MSEYEQPLPAAFCWTRMGSEAGQRLDEIVERKERERIASGGTFLWGIGNGVANALAELAGSVAVPEVLFSPVKGRPRRIDLRPDGVAVWTAGVTLTGERYPIPRTSRVTSGVAQHRPIPPRYALVCYSDDRLELRDRGRLPFTELRNLLSDRPVGASQVTAVVRWRDSGRAGQIEMRDAYQVCLRARLIPPYVVRLCDPVVFADAPAALAAPPALVA